MAPERAADPSVEGGLQAAVQVLRRTAEAVAGPLTMADMLAACTQAVVDELDAAFARIWVLDDGLLRLRASSGCYTHLDGDHRAIPVGAFKIGRIAERREPHLTNDVPGDPHVTNPEWARAEGMTAFAGYPLIVGGDLVGVLALFARHPLEASTLDVLGSVAHSVALGIQRLQAESELQAEREVIDALHEIGTELAGQHRLDDVAQAATDAATSLTGAQLGAFSYNAVTEDGEHYMLHALAGVDRGRFEDSGLASSMARLAPELGGLGVIRYHDITEDPPLGAGDRCWMLPEDLPIRSCLAAPVISSTGEGLGGLFLGHPEPGRFTERHERLVAGLAEQAAVAVGGAQLYEREHRLALRFQEGFLPQRIPPVPGGTIAVQYRPASELTDIGGDWYDVTSLAGDRTAVSVGDVSGHDVQAAVIMGQLRMTLKAYSLDGAAPDAALTRLDAFMLATDVPLTATAIQAVFDPTAGTLRVARAGHLPPLIVSADGDATFVPLRELRGPILGVAVDLGPRTTVEVALRPRDRVVFFTDGLIERRREPLDVGMERLRAFAGGLIDLGASAMAVQLMRELTRNEREDDAALLVLAVD